MHFFTHFHWVLTLCLEASGRREFARGWSLSALRSDALICLSLSLCPFDYIYSSPSFSFSLSSPLSLSFPSSYSFPSQWRPSSQSASVTLLQDVHVELWPREPGLPKTVTWFKVANKLAANYLSNTCWRRCWEAPLTKEQLAKETRRGHFHLTRNHYLTTPCLFSAPGESVNIITYHHLLGCDTDPKWRVSCHTRRSLRDK